MAACCRLRRILSAAEGAPLQSFVQESVLRLETPAGPDGRSSSDGGRSSSGGDSSSSANPPPSVSNYPLVFDEALTFAFCVRASRPLPFDKLVSTTVTFAPDCSDPSARIRRRLPFDL